MKITFTLSIFLLSMSAGLGQPTYGPYPQPGTGGGGGGLSNSPVVSAGVNTVVTPTQITPGQTNFTIAVADPFSVATLWATNMVTPTNSFAGTLINFSKAESLTNATGNISITGFANVVAGGVNMASLTVLANGADRSVTVPSGVHIGRASTLVVTNGTSAKFLFELWPGTLTNVDQIDHL